jgi:hypothetical protein
MREKNINQNRILYRLDQDMDISSSETDYEKEETFVMQDQIYGE